MHSLSSYACCLGDIFHAAVWTRFPCAVHVAFDLYHNTCIPPALVPSDAATCSSPHCCRKQLPKPSQNCGDLYGLEFPFSRSACRVHGNPSQTPDSPLFKVQQLQKLGLRAISGAVWFEKQEGSVRAGGQCFKPRLLQEEQGWGGISLPLLPAWTGGPAVLS